MPFGSRIVGEVSSCARAILESKVIYETPDACLRGNHHNRNTTDSWSLNSGNLDYVATSKTDQLKHDKG